MSPAEMALQALLFALGVVLALLAVKPLHPALLPLAVASIAGGLLVTPLAALF